MDKLSGGDTGMEPRLIQADEYLLVAEKPSGLLSVPGRGPEKQDCLSARVLRQYPDALVVHRLDQATSGLMLLARGSDVQRLLSQMFAQRQVKKRYVAVVAGQLGLPAEAVDGWAETELPLAVDWPNRPRRVVDRLHGKPSLTRWRVLEHDEAGETTRLELEPVTGRTHQLRVHLQALGHPILGDALYAPAGVAARSQRLLLHACRLELPHPVRGDPLSFTSAVPF